MKLDTSSEGDLDDESPQFRRSRTSFESDQLEHLEKVKIVIYHILIILLIKIIKLKTFFEIESIYVCLALVLLWSLIYKC